LYLKKKIRDAQRGTYPGRSHLFSAMEKYPSTAWGIIPLISNLTTNEELCYWETVLIKAFNTRCPEVGYNICKGGEGWTGRHSEESRRRIGEATRNRPGPWHNRPMSKEHRRKLGATHKGHPSGMLNKHHSEESRKKMSNAKKGKPSPWRGKHFSAESRKKLSISLKGKPWTERRRKAQELKRRASETTKL
jgi:hypothetical protein